MTRTILFITWKHLKREKDPCGWFYSQKAQVKRKRKKQIEKQITNYLTIKLFFFSSSVISDDTRLKSKEFADKLHMVH